MVHLLRGPYSACPRSVIIIVLVKGLNVASFSTVMIVHTILLLLLLVSISILALMHHDHLLLLLLSV